MRITKWSCAACAAVALLLAALAPAVMQNRHAGASSAALSMEVASVDGPQRGTQPSRGRPSGAPSPARPPSSEGRPPSAGHPPSSGHPPSDEHLPSGRERPQGTTGRVPPPSRPPEFRYPHAPAAPLRQRVYPVQGHDHTPSHIFLPHHHYPGPFFAFRPQYWLGFGLYVGYPVVYPWWFGYPDYVYVSGQILALPAPPAATAYGGICLDIDPDTATVVVDGVEVGLARDFSATEQPLTLAPGRHHVELFASGLQPLAFDVEVIPGQVIPFSGVLQPR